MAARKKTNKTDLAAETNPSAPLDSRAFLAAAGPVLAGLKTDLDARVDASPAVRAALEARHAEEKKQLRTGDSFVEWRAHFIEQVAAAWLLSCVFVRTLEDRGLLGNARLAGPGAQDSQRLFFELAPSLTERDYLLTVFRELSHFKATRALFDKRNPVWLLAPSGEAAKALLGLFRAPTADAPAFRFGQKDTRFLGDLYQDLDEGVRKRFALLQTPDFVEEYILDKTLEPAIARFGLEETTLIDPTCGSGHFLLGAFARLFEHRRRAEPGASVRDAVMKALAAVAGADINPYAIAIARLRLTLAALERAEISKLASAPELPLRLAVADSLLYNPQLKQLQIGTSKHATAELANAMLGEAYALDDPRATAEVLNRQYCAVVGNPPYITCKDATLRDQYKILYESCHREYSLGVPFTERFFHAAVHNGFIGMITANSFMKREFGKKLIETVLPKWNLTNIENSSGAYIPGHGTPTVLLFGTACTETAAPIVTVLANRGEPATPSDPSKGFVWQSIEQHSRDLNFENEYISVANMDRAVLRRHPWSLGGGGASDLKALLEERAASQLSDIVELIGFGAVTREDEAFTLAAGSKERFQIPDAYVKTYGFGEVVRDWSIDSNESVFFPYDEQGTADAQSLGRYIRVLWRYRTQLWLRQGKGFKTKKESGGQFYEYSMFYPDRHFSPLRIAFAFIATHNHFVLDRGGKVFKQSAPIIKLPEGATEDDHLALLAYLNSSTACFWMKQVFFDKGNRGEGGGFTSEQWEKFYEFDGTKLQALPIPSFDRPTRDKLIEIGRRMLDVGQRRTDLTATASSLIDSAIGKAKLARDLQGLAQSASSLESELYALQEKLDWLIYSTVGLIDTPPPPTPERIVPGARASDVRFAERVVGGEPGRRYFELCRLPSPEAIAAPDWREFHGLNDKLAICATNAEVAQIEQPVYKRTFREGLRPLEWTTIAREWLSQLLESTISGRQSTLETSVIWKQTSSASGMKAADGALFNGSAREVCSELLARMSAPFLAAQRFSEAGLNKYAEWNACWASQRAEDNGGIIGPSSVPPKYVQADFRLSSLWQLRGKLDVPKERFISYPGCESDEDGSPVYGWAGWNHLEQAQALAALYNDRKDREGWAKDRLVPMLAGILELLPWVKQWHNEPNDDFDGLRLGEYFDGFLQTQMRELGVTTADLESWRPEARTRRTTKRKA